MVSVELIKKKDDNSPNIRAIIDLPGIIPVRGYLFDTLIEKAYGQGNTTPAKGNLVQYVPDFSLNNAINHFVIRSELMGPYDGAEFVIGFASAKDWNDSKRRINRIDRAIIYWPFVPSNGNSKKKASPFLVKSDVSEQLGLGVQQAITPNINYDMIRILSNEVDSRMFGKPILENVISLF